MDNRQQLPDGTWVIDDGVNPPMMFNEATGQWEVMDRNRNTPPPMPGVEQFRHDPNQRDSMMYQPGHEGADAVANSLDRFLDVLTKRKGRLIWSGVFVFFLGVYGGTWLSDTQDVSFYGLTRQIVAGDDPARNDVERGDTIIVEEAPANVPTTEPVAETTVPVEEEPTG